MPSFNFRNLFSGHSRPAEQPEYQYPHGSFSESVSSHVPSPNSGAFRSKNLATNQWTDRMGPTSRGATVVDYDDHTDSSSIFTDGVLVQDSNQIPNVHRQYSEDSLTNSNLDDADEGVVPVRSRAHRRSSSNSTSTRSSDRTGSDRGERPPRIIPEYSRPYSEHRSEYTVGTQYTHSSELHPHEQTHSRSRGHRRTKRRSGDRVGQAPVILMFENGYGGYDNMWYVMPGATPVIFQDSDGNEITRVGDFSQAASTRTQPPIVFDQYGSNSPRHPNIHPHQLDPGSEHYATQVTSEHSHRSQRHRSARSPPTSPTPSVTFINLQSNGPPQPHNLEPLRAHPSPGSNVIYMDSRGRPLPPTSSKTSSRSHSVASDQGRSYVSHPGTAYT